MARYQEVLSNPDIILDTENGAFIPRVEGNSQYAEYLAWVEEGNTVDPAPLVDLIAIRQAEVNAHRNARLFGGYTDTAGSGKAFQTDPESISKINATGALALAAIVTSQNPTFNFIATDNTIVSMNKLEAPSWAQRIASFVSATMLYARSVKTAIAALPDRASVLSYDITAGWPANS